MEPEVQPPPFVRPPAKTGEALTPADNLSVPPELPVPTPEALEYRGLRWIFIGPNGLRAGWSVTIFILLIGILGAAIGAIFASLHLVDFSKRNDFTPRAAFFGEALSFLALVSAAGLVALIERRRSLLAFNLTGPRRTFHFVSGLVGGFAALSALMGSLAWGGWLHFGPVALSGSEIFRFGAFWACAFLQVGCVEEGVFRCYLQFTLTRGINFWWALGIIAALCGSLMLRSRGNGVWGVYLIALLGLLPCLWVHLAKRPGGGFWQAAWVTSTLFGYIHTGNNGENWIGIFAAAGIGFVFCVSIWATGSAWWAIGCHAAWDWGETYFYGAADSGNVATGHYLTTNPVGNPFWSGGADGPEGSVLILGIILLLLVALIAIYGRKRSSALVAPVVGHGAGLANAS